MPVKKRLTASLNDEREVYESSLIYWITERLRRIRASDYFSMPAYESDGGWPTLESGCPIRASVARVGLFVSGAIGA